VLCDPNPAREGEEEGCEAPLLPEPLRLGELNPLRDELEPGPK
jgi:hypothetical protein